MCSRMEEAESLNALREDGLLRTLVEAVRKLKALRSFRDHHLEVAVGRECQRGEEGGRGAQDGGGGKGGEEVEEAEGRSPDEEECIWKVMHVLREVSVSHSDRVTSWGKALRECSCILAKSPPEGSNQPPAPTGREHQDIFSNLLLSIEEDVQNVQHKLVCIVTKLNEESLKFHKEASNGQTRPSSEHLEEEGHLNEQGRLGLDPPSHVQLVPSDATPAAESSSKLEEKGLEESAADNNKADAVTQGNQRDNLEETLEKMKDRGLITVGLTCSGVPDACFIRRPDALSCLMVCRSEELVSRVIWIRFKDGTRLRSPLTVVLPFCGSYRGSYRDVVVKMVDNEGRRSYVAPLATEGTYGGQWGLFAEVRVYRLGLLAVVSCLKKENYSSNKGLVAQAEHGPPNLSELPGRMLCSSGDSTSNGPADGHDPSGCCQVQDRRLPFSGLHQSGSPPHPPILSAPEETPRPQPPLSSKPSKEKAGRRARGISRTTKLRGETCTQKPCDLTSLAEELEESAHSHAVTLVLQRRPEEPDAVLVAALPSRELSWELTKLRAQGYSGLPEASTDLSMCEGDQLILQFSSNITTKECEQNQRLTFHTQLQSHILLHLAEVDPFGNYSSPHYKGRVIFYRVSRDRLKQWGDGPRLADAELLDDPVCKLSLTLPKRPRTVHRPNVACVKSCEERDSLSDSLLLWLSAELSEEEVSLLVPSLRLHRSAAQLVMLRAGNSPSTQAFHVLAMWRRGLPAASWRPKTSQLARSLTRIGRPDLAGELLLRQAEACGQKSEQPDLKVEERFANVESDGCNASLYPQDGII